MEPILYCMVAYGCNVAGMPFWRSVLWPVECGKMIARAIGEGGE